MNELRIPMDPLNPGHFYACCGLLELMEPAHSWLESRFEVVARVPRRAEFLVRSKDPIDLKAALKLIRSAEYKAQIVGGGEDESVAILPMAVIWPGRELWLDWWLNEFHDKATSLKGWGGQMTSQSLFDELPQYIDEDLDPKGLFVSARAVSSRFGVDPRSSWKTLDLGYSLNEQGQDALTYPAVEMLAAFGLQRFRPAERNRDRVNYALWSEWLHLSVAGLAANQPWEGLEVRPYEFKIAKRGQGYKYFTFGTPSRNQNLEETE